MGCSLENVRLLQKKVEMHKAKDQSCAFVQTWHANDNPHFLDSIIPGLKRGYALYHGSDDDVEDYEKEGVCSYGKSLIWIPRCLRRDNSFCLTQILLLPNAFFC